MSRIVNRDGAQVYCMRPGDETPYVQLWPDYGYLVEYSISGTNEIIWYASKEHAQKTMEDLRSQIGREDDFAFGWSVTDDPIPTHAREIREAAKAVEDTRHYYLIRLDKHPANPSTGTGPYWLDDPNSAMDSDLVCGPFTTLTAAYAARQHLATDPSTSSLGDYYTAWSYEYPRPDSIIRFESCRQLLWYRWPETTTVT